MKICFALKHYFNDCKGGAELQALLISKYLKEKDNEIAYLRHGAKDVDECVQDGAIDVYSIKKSEKKKYLFPEYKSKNVFQILDKINADIYYQRGFHYADILLKYTKYQKKKFVLGISSDSQCIPNKLNISVKEFLKYLNDRWNLKCIKNADLIIAQTHHQKRLLKKYFSRDSIVILNGQPMPSPPFKKSSPPIIAWIANIKQIKQPEVFIKLAEECQDLNAQFLYAGRPAKGKYQKSLIEKTKNLHNLKYLGEISLEKTDELLSKSSVLVNTSVFEGFSNTYIQAWMRETPVVALNADPDNLIKKRRMGFNSNSFEQLVKDVRYLIENDGVRQEMGGASRKYAVENHDIEKIGKRYQEVFNEFVKKR